MTKNKHFRSVFAALLCAVLCMTAFATVAYADGGDYYDDELPPETWQEEPQPEDTTIVPALRSPRMASPQPAIFSMINTPTSSLSPWKP